MLGADFSAATVLISFGAVLGKTSPVQLVVMAMIEITIFASNEHLGLHTFKVNYVHSFQKLFYYCHISGVLYPIQLVSSND